jgi:hypothetical protein
MEVPMSKTTRRTLQFESLEGKVLLSSGMVNPAATIFKYKAVRFHLNGNIAGVPGGTAGPSGFLVSSFPIAGHVTSMGNVSGAFYLMHTFVPFGKLPDLSKSSLVLGNQKGSVAIAMNASGSHHYKFKIMSGSGIYTFASGSGNLTISASSNSPNFIIKMRSGNS